MHIKVIRLCWSEILGETANHGGNPIANSVCEMASALDKLGTFLAFSDKTSLRTPLTETNPSALLEQMSQPTLSIKAEVTGVHAARRLPSNRLHFQSTDKSFV